MFAADVTVPDHSVVPPGERFTKTWAVQNAGQLPWPERRLVRLDEEIVIARRLKNGGFEPLLDSHLSSLGRTLAVPAAPPGQVLELSVDFQAPLENCTVASVWRFEDVQGVPCYRAHCFLQVVVSVMG